jgi:hypothetical protein
LPVIAFEPIDPQPQSAESSFGLNLNAGLQSVLAAFHRDEG